MNSIFQSGTLFCPPLTLEVFDIERFESISTPLSGTSSTTLTPELSPFNLALPKFSEKRYIFESGHPTSPAPTTPPKLNSLMQSHLDHLTTSGDKLREFQALVQILKCPLYKEFSDQGNYIRAIAASYIDTLSDNFFFILDLKRFVITPDDLCSQLEERLSISPRVAYEEFVASFPEPNLLAEDSPEMLTFVSKFVVLLFDLSASNESIDNWNKADIKEKLIELWSSFDFEKQESIIKRLNISDLKGLSSGNLRAICYTKPKF